MDLTAGKVIEILELEPLDIEGGYFRELWRSPLTVPAEELGGQYPSDRGLGTSIYYLLTPDTVSAMHRLPGDEIFHFYLGDPVRMLQLSPGGGSDEIGIGTDLGAGQRPQVVVPGGVWQGCCLAPGGEFALMGTTVVPGFEYEDFEIGRREELTAQYPAHKDLIRLLTPDKS